MGNVVMLGFSLMIVKCNMRYEGYENHMWKICIFLFLNMVHIQPCGH